MTNDEINRAMAEKVMGWHRFEHPEHDGDWFWADSVYTWMLDLDEWNPATDLNDAMRAVEEFIGGTDIFFEVDGSSGNQGYVYSARFKESEFGEELSEDASASMSSAICHALLAASKKE